MAASIEQAREAKAKAASLAGAIAAVVGVGITRVADSYAVKINLRAPADADLPDEIDGVPIVYEVTGVARKQL